LPRGAPPEAAERAPLLQSIPGDNAMTMNRRLTLLALAALPLFAAAQVERNSRR